MPQWQFNIRHFVCAIALVVVIAICALYNQSLFDDPRTFMDVVNKDFANYWIASRAVQDGNIGILFGPHEAYLGHMRAVFGPNYPWHNWSYPPHYLLMIWPVGYLPYGVSMVVFLVVTGAMFYAAAHRFLGRLDLGALMLLSAFLFSNVVIAQNGFLSGAFLLGALAFRFDKPILAGILAGCLTVKPQLGILIPVLFLIEMRWTAIVSAAVTTIVLVLVSALVFGIDAWRGFVAEVIPYQSGVMSDATGIFLYMMPSLFGSLRALSFDAHFALLVHIVFALPVALLAVWAMLSTGDARLRANIALVATFILTPYSLVYDLGPVAVAAAAARSTVPEARRVDGFMILTPLAFTPILTISLGSLGIPLTPAIMLAALLLMSKEALRRAVHGPASSLAHWQGWVLQRRGSIRRS